MKTIKEKINELSIEELRTRLIQEYSQALLGIKETILIIDGYKNKGVDEDNPRVQECQLANLRRYEEYKERIKLAGLWKDEYNLAWKAACNEKLDRNKFIELCQKDIE